MNDQAPVAPENLPEPPSSRPRKGCILFTILGILVLLFMGYFVTQLIPRPLVISEETTYITEPLKSDGEQVDYFAAIERETYPANMATEENGVRLIVERIQLDVPREPWQYDQLCRKLGIDPATNAPDLVLVGPELFMLDYLQSEAFDPSEFEHLLPEPIVEEGEEEAFAPAGDREAEVFKLLEKRYQKPWTLDDLPMMATWLDEIDPVLDIAAEAVRKPSFRIPLTRENEDSTLLVLELDDVQAMRKFARGLQARANYRVATGDIDGAIDDIVTVKRLGRHVGHGSTLIEMLVGIAIEGAADATGIAGSLEHPPTKEQIQRLLDEYDALPPRVSYQQAMRFERFQSLDIFQSLAFGGEGDIFDGGSGVPRAALQIGIDWNVVLSRFNDHFDALLDKGVEPPRPALSVSLLLSRGARSEQLCDVLASLLLPACQAAQEANRRCGCVERMHRITLAMLLYECDHGTLPPAYTVDDEGRPLHSWRVLLLPYLGEKERALYDKIRLDEPWDSEHNAAFHLEDLPVFRCPSSKAKPGEASYRVVVGPDMPFEGGEGKRLSNFGPESEDMILVVETNDPCCWMDPTQEIAQAAADEGINPAAALSLRGVASEHPGGANIGFRDGSVRFLSERLEPEAFQALLRGTNDRLDF